MNCRRDEKIKVLDIILDKINRLNKKVWCSNEYIKKFLTAKFTNSKFQDVKIAFRKVCNN
jgi:hypothetical protein